MARRSGSRGVEEEPAGFDGIDRFTFEVTDPAAARTMREQAAAHGRSVEAELDALVRKTYGPTEDNVPDGPDESWAEKLIRITRPGFETDPFERQRIPLRETNL